MIESRRAQVEGLSIADAGSIGAISRAHRTAHYAGEPWSVGVASIRAPKAGRNRAWALLLVRWSLSMCIFVAALLAPSSVADAAVTHVYTGSSFGPDGTAGTAFGNPTNVAIDQQTGAIYVADSSTGTLYKFDGSHQPSDFSALGSNQLTSLNLLGGRGLTQVAVDSATHKILITSGNAIHAFAESGEPADFSALGSSELSGFAELLGVATDADGTLYAADYQSGVSVYAATGAPFSSFASGQAANVAVDKDGEVYLSHYESVVEKFNPSFFPVSALTTYDPGIVVDPFASFNVAIDPGTNDLYVTERTGIAQYDETHDRTVVFAKSGEPGALSAPAGVAIVGTSGEVLAVDEAGARQVAIYGPTVRIPGIQLQAATGVDGQGATLHGWVNPEGFPILDCKFDYVTQAAFTASGFSDLSSGGTASCNPPASEIPTDNENHVVAAELSGLEAGTVYRYRLGANNGEGLGYSVDGSFQTLRKPTIENESLQGAAATEAFLGADINAGGAPTTFYIEYGLDETYGQSSPERNVGATFSDRSVSVVLTGLLPTRQYHWRVVASNRIGVTQGSDQILSTSGGSYVNNDCSNTSFRVGVSASLPDCRAYELVSPVDKNNTDILSLINIQSIIASLDQSSDGGDRITYTTSQGFAGALGVPYVSQYLSSRATGGWSTENITPPQGLSRLEIGERLDIEFRAFTRDLCVAALHHDTDLTLAPAAIPGGFPNLYLRRNCGESSYEALTTVEPPGLPPAAFRPEVQGMSADGRCIAFNVRGQLTPNAHPDEGFRQLYESCDGEIRLVSVLPGGETHPFGSSAGTANQELAAVGIRTASVARAISDDGSRIYWTDRSQFAGGIYLRVNAKQPQSTVSGGECIEAAKGCTIPVSDIVTGADAFFLGASSDGERALFRIEEEESPLNRNLYEFDLRTRSANLVASNTMGVIGTSEDARRVFFVSPDVLTVGTNAAGVAPVGGEPNLYFSDAATGPPDRIQFIGTLSAADARSRAPSYSPVNLEPYKKTSRISPDGYSVAFMSSASLTGYNNSDLGNGEQDSEIYVYNARDNEGRGRLRCISCNPTGKRPVGRNLLIEGYPSDIWAAAFLPPYDTDLYGSRVISDDGRRAYFTGYEALVPSDTNAKADAYQWEVSGSGDCSVSNPSYSAMTGGCISLISTGQSNTDSEFIDASADGRDVFFATASSLVPEDPGLIDIYDARAGGGFPLPPGAPSACDGEGCQGQASAPSDEAPASMTFNGPGNVKNPGRTRCHKMGRRWQKGRCLRKSKKHSTRRGKPRLGDQKRRSGR